MFRLGLSFFICFCVIYICIWNTRTKCATHWRFEEGEVSEVLGEESSILEKDPLFRLLSKSWSSPNSESSPHDIVSGDTIEIKEHLVASEDTAMIPSLPASEMFNRSVLHCGDPVNNTSIDHLAGIRKRFVHPSYPEPEVALLFRQNEFDNVQTEVIEVNLIDALRSVENRVVLFNQVGNFLRIKGDTYHAIECFRSALHISSDNPDVLLNLAVVLLNLNYVEDAIYLTHMSLDVQLPPANTWLQHFTLAEILERNGELDKAWSHFRSALDQNPTFHPVQMKLKSLSNAPSSVNFNVYTTIVISVLCICMLLYFTTLFTAQKV